MYCHLINRIGPFFLAFALSTLAVTTFQRPLLDEEIEATVSPSAISGSGGGTSSGFVGCGECCPEPCAVATGPDPRFARVKRVTPYQITSKPRPRYTDDARANGIEGTVRLKVTLLASGRIGSITPVKTLPDGLTEQAIAAAGQIKFQPKRINGVPISWSVTIDYNFTIY